MLIRLSVKLASAREIVGIIVSDRDGVVSLVMSLNQDWRTKKWQVAATAALKWFRLPALTSPWPGRNRHWIRRAAVETLSANFRRFTTFRPAFSNFAHATKFDLLGDLTTDDDDGSLSPSPDRKRAKSKGSSIASDYGNFDTFFPVRRPTMMPAFDCDSDFWKVYANKLQVNGTLEGIFCKPDWKVDKEANSSNFSY